MGLSDRVSSGECGLEKVVAGRERRGTRRGEGFARLGGGGMGLAEWIGLFEN
jgi:hypothetical protein